MIVSWFFIGDRVMKRDVSIPHILQGSTTATIVIDKNGLRVENKSEPCSDSSVIRGYITQMIDMDEWKQSWHIDVAVAQFKHCDERKKVKQIMLDKIEMREKEIQQLKDGIQILSRWNIKTN